MQNKFLRSELTKGSSFSCLFFNLALFSFQDAVFVVLRGFILSRRLIYYTTFSEVCQVFFQSFLKNFFRTTPNLSYSELLSAVPLGQLASFSIIPHFQKFVKRFFRSFFQTLSFSSRRFCGFYCPLLALRLPSGLAANLFIIPHFRFLVKCFFKISFGFHSTSFSSNYFRLFNFL